jgi:hypothetical protein
MMKTCDRVKWDYIHGCLSKLGFNTTWIQSVMRCVTCVRYVVRVNAKLAPPVVPPLYLERYLQRKDTKGEFVANVQGEVMKSFLL